MSTSTTTMKKFLATTAMNVVIISSGVLNADVMNINVESLAAIGGVSALKLRMKEKPNPENGPGKDGKKKFDSNSESSDSDSPQKKKVTKIKKQVSVIPKKYDEDEESSSWESFDPDTFVAMGQEEHKELELTSDKRSKLHYDGKTFDENGVPMPTLTGKGRVEPDQESFPLTTLTGRWNYAKEALKQAGFDLDEWNSHREDYAGPIAPDVKRFLPWELKAFWKSLWEVAKYNPVFDKDTKETTLTCPKCKVTITIPEFCTIKEGDDDKTKEEKQSLLNAIVWGLEKHHSKCTGTHHSKCT